MKKLFLFLILCFSLSAQVTVTETATLPAADWMGVIVASPTSAATYTTDTALNFCALYHVNTTATLFVIVNIGTATATISNGLGVSLTGTMTIPAGASRLFLLYSGTCINGAVSTFKLQSLGSFSSL
jgi:hypothetical protein